jgi:hypothetical protein
MVAGRPRTTFPGKKVTKIKKKKLTFLKAFFTLNQLASHVEVRCGWLSVI